jgi:hypothetical protein
MLVVVVITAARRWERRRRSPVSAGFIHPMKNGGGAILGLLGCGNFEPYVNGGAWAA